MLDDGKLLFYNLSLMALAKIWFTTDNHLILVLVSDLQREESSSLVTELRAELAQRERELQKMKEGAEELNSLRQKIFLLQSQV